MYCLLFYNSIYCLVLLFFILTIKMLFNLIRIVTGKNRCHAKNFYINHKYPEFTLLLLDSNNNPYLFTIAVIVPILYVSTISSQTEPGPQYISRTLKSIDRCKINDKLPYSRARYYTPVKKYILDLPLNVQDLQVYKSNVVSWNDNNLSIELDKTYFIEDKRFRALENPLEANFIVRKLHDLQYRHYFHITPEAGNVLQSSFAFIFNDLWKGDDIFSNVSKYTDDEIFRIKVKKHLDKLPRDMLPDYYLQQSKYKVAAFLLGYMINNIIHLKMISPDNNYTIDIDDVKVGFYSMRFDPIFKDFYNNYLIKYV